MPRTSLLNGGGGAEQRNKAACLILERIAEDEASLSFLDGL
jgi:hypothetical protein